MTKVEVARKQLEAKFDAMMQTFERDVYAGRRDAETGYYDMWYCHNREDGGAAYDAGWMDVHFTEAERSKEIQVIEG